MQDRFCEAETFRNFGKDDRVTGFPRKKTQDAYQNQELTNEFWNDNNLV